MPEISAFGWFHTIMGIIALLTGFYTLVKYKVISLQNLTGKIYLLTTLLAAASALGIYARGEFNIAHALAILTLLALAAGFIAEKTQVLGKLSPYAQALCYSATLLFHMIPAITDGLMRLPVSDPVVTHIEDPMLKAFYLVFLIAYVVGFSAQVLWLRKRT
ncbi:hypothetical protein [Aliiglaciecola litoralis]|uniref:DUF2306 domain-containing protein n=1 Tax=Aliiglaciecola litoralis TaxID=582857 RepID=A0ABN1LCX6_9ALTE